LNADVFLTALDLPSASRVDQRVPKKLLLENGAPTASDKRNINEGIDELLWLAALKPTTVGIPEYRDDAREYLEIAVLRLTLRADAKATRLIELVHRAVPYPVFLLAEQNEEPGLSLAHKRWSQGEVGKTVLDGQMVSVEWDATRDAANSSAFCQALGLGRQPRTTLYGLYQGWIDTVLALHAARRSSAFVVAISADEAAARREALQECEHFEAEIGRLRAAGAKEKQISRQVEINLELKRFEANLALAKGRL